MTLTWLSLAAVMLLLLTTLLSAINLALVQVSDSALERRLERSGRLESGRWIFGRKEQVDHAVAFLRTMGRIGFFALVLMEVVGDDGVITWAPVLGSFAVAALLIWFFTSVVSSAVARYASAGLLSGTLPMLRLLDVALRPLTKPAEIVDEAVKRLVGANLVEDEAEEDLLRSIEDTERQGGIDATSAQMMENVVEFSDTLVGSIMTPRTAIEGIEYTDDLAAIRGFIHEDGHSRVPVYEESLDHVVGVLYVKDLVRWVGAAAGDFKLRPLLHEPIRVPESKRVSELLRDFQRGKVHMAIVVDEYGGTAGLVTIEDVLEEIVGEIRDEHDLPEASEPGFREVSAGVLEADGRCPVADLNARLDVQLPEDEGYDTIAGFVLSRLGRVPEVGATVEGGGARVKVQAAGPTAIVRVSVERVAPRD
ncbi:MAG: HlyC/CorC family transporter [Planctomycetes bacterium]|nr:HlyC/CorC family transporter [Planctomycetota bacterium]